MNYFELKKKALMHNVRNELPYTELAYIEGTGTQYINTGIIADNETGILTETAITAYINMQDGVYEEQNTENRNRLYPPYFHNATHAGYGWIDYISIETEGYFKADTFYKAQTNYMNSRTYSLSENGQILYQGNISGAERTENSSPICIFCSRITAQKRQKAKKKYFIITQGERIVFNGIPVMRKSDGEICIYDKVSKQFFTNQGTGAFLYGEVV